MNTYIVRLTIQAGEYEKSNTKIVNALSEAHARDEALLGECHGDIDDGTAEWTSIGILDLGGEFHYRVSDCSLVSPEHVEVLSHYLNGVGFSGSQLVDEPVTEQVCVRGSLTIIVLPEKSMFHFCQEPLSGIGNEAWYPYVEDELFQYVERFLVAGNVAGNVVSVEELRQCGNSIDYLVTYNKCEG